MEHTNPKLSTNELLSILHSTNTVSELQKFNQTLENNKGFNSFSEYILHIINDRSLSETQLIHDSNIHRTYAYQILNGSKKPGRDKVISLALVAHMTFEETQRALTLADAGQLYARRKRDSILIFAIENSLNIQTTNELLYEEGENILE